ncbi:MAG: hypothetical protein ACI8QZ_001679 [Chlamydiales bacterium]|jgi:hypothetical protein
MTPLPIFLALSATFGAFPPVGAVGALPAASVEPELGTVAYELLAEQPGSYLGRELRLVMQFHSLEESWNPFLTRFSPTEFIAARGWTDAQLPWVRSEFERTPVRVFASRRADVLTRFFGLGQRHERIALTCVVREVFAGQPWIEVLAAEVLQESIPEGSVLHAIRALDFEQKRAFGLALGELERARAAPLPKHATLALAEIEERCRRARSGQ